MIITKYKSVYYYFQSTHSTYYHTQTGRLMSDNDIRELPVTPSRSGTTIIESAVLLPTCALDTLSHLKDKLSVDKLLFDIIIINIFTVVDYSAYKASSLRPTKVIDLTYNIHLAQPSSSLSYKITFADESHSTAAHPSNSTFRDFIKNSIESSWSDAHKQQPQSVLCERRKRRNLVLILADKKKQKVTVDIDNPLCTTSRLSLP